MLLAQRLQLGEGVLYIGVAGKSGHDGGGGPVKVRRHIPIEVLGKTGGALQHLLAGRLNGGELLLALPVGGRRCRAGD